MTKWHISSAVHTSGNGKKNNLKADVSDPSQVTGNITVIFKRIKIDPQILFSILLSNLIVITRIKSLGSHLKRLQPQNTNVNKLLFRFSYYSFKMKIHCYLRKAGLSAISQLACCPNSELLLSRATVSFPLAASLASMSVRQVRAAYWYKGFFLFSFFCNFSFQLCQQADPMQGLTGMDAIKDCVLQEQGTEG